MSKRLGNVVDPVKACADYGADVVRYWVAGTDYANDVPCSDPILKQFGESYRNIRNALRFLIGNLKGHTADSVETLLPIDQWFIEQADLLVADCIDAYERFDFGTVMSSVHNFCRQQLSAFYADAVKDRMYCDAEDSAERRSGQQACYEVAEKLIKLIAPVLVHTAEESWLKMHETLGVKPTSVFFETFDAVSIDEIEGSELQQRFAAVIAAKQVVNSSFEPYKGTDGIKNSQDVVAKLAVDATEKQLLETFTADELANFFKVSWVELAEGEPAVTFVKSPYNECIRSRVRRPDVAEVEVDGEKVFLSARDRKVLDL
jgi:isoleucyl-tRNA synthetase